MYKINKYKNYAIVQEQESLMVEGEKNQPIRELILENQTDQLLKLAKLIRLKQKLAEKNHKRVILDRCELDTAIYCGKLCESIEIRLKRWYEINKDIGDMIVPDLVIYFELYKKGIHNKEKYLFLDTQYQKIWADYKNNHNTKIIYVKPKINLQTKIKEVTKIIDENSTWAKRIVFTGPPHSGKTSTLQGIIKQDIHFDTIKIS